MTYFPTNKISRLKNIARCLIFAMMYSSTALENRLPDESRDIRVSAWDWKPASFSVTF